MLKKKRKQHLFVVKVCKNNKLLLIHVVFLIFCCFSQKKKLFLPQFVEKTKTTKNVVFGTKPRDTFPAPSSLSVNPERCLGIVWDPQKPLKAFKGLPLTAFAF